MDEIELFKRKLKREKAARKEAEAILEKKSADLYSANLNLKKLAEDGIEKEKFTGSILEAAADSIIVLDEQFLIIRCNKSATELFGLDSENLMGKALDIYVRDIDIQKIIQNENHDLYEGIVIQKDEINVPIELNISKIDLISSIIYVCSIRNIYQRKQIESYLKMLNLITEIIAKNSSFFLVIPDILSIIATSVDAEIGIFWKNDPTKNKLIFINAWYKELNTIKVFLEDTKRMEFSKKEGLPGSAWEKMAPEIISDITTNDNFIRKKAAKESHINSGFAFPIIFDGNVLGVIEFYMVHGFPIDENFKKLFNEISLRIGSFIEKEQANIRLLDSQRQAGMAEVATSVLHNIGNVLNSVNVSATMLEQNVSTSKLSDLTALNTMLQNPADSLVTTLASHNKGKILIDYIKKLAEFYETEHLINIKEIKLLVTNIQYIKQIIKSQQSFAVAVAINEPVNLTNLINEALAMNGFDFAKKNVCLELNFAFDAAIVIDRIKVIQVLINLISNAC